MMYIDYAVNYTFPWSMYIQSWNTLTFALITTTDLSNVPSIQSFNVSPSHPLCVLFSIRIALRRCRRSYSTGHG